MLPDPSGSTLVSEVISVNNAANEPTCYTFELRVKGHLEPTSFDWLRGLSLQQEPQGHTLLGNIPGDQAVLHGLLGRMRDLGLSILALRQVSQGEVYHENP